MPAENKLRVYAGNEPRIGKITTTRLTGGLL